MLHNVPTACNRATADFVESSPLLARAYDRDRTFIDRRTRVAET